MDWERLSEELRADKNRFYLVLSGDKGFKSDDYFSMSVKGQIVMLSGYDVFKAFVLKLLANRISAGNEIRFVSGDNNGTDAMTESLASEMQLDVYKYVADWDKNGSKAGFVRNEEMFFKVGSKPNKGAILFWNGTDVYTRNLIFQAYIFGTPCRVYNYVTKRWLSTDEIEDIQFEERQKQINYKRKKNESEGN